LSRWPDLVRPATIALPTFALACFQRCPPLLHPLIDVVAARTPFFP
jgi:hypothetical protein